MIEATNLTVCIPEETLSGSCCALSHQDRQPQSLVLRTHGKGYSHGGQSVRTTVHGLQEPQGQTRDTHLSHLRSFSQERGPIHNSAKTMTQKSIPEIEGPEISLWPGKREPSPGPGITLRANCPRPKQRTQASADSAVIHQPYQWGTMTLKCAAQQSRDQVCSVWWYTVGLRASFDAMGKCKTMPM